MENLKLEETGLKHIDDTSSSSFVGECGEQVVKTKLLTLGFSVSQPSVTTGYDFITDWKGVLNRVQVKTTNSLMTHPRTGTSYYRFRSKNALGNFTILICYVIPNNNFYVIPWHISRNKHMINIPVGRTDKKYSIFKNNFHLLKEPH